MAAGDLFCRRRPRHRLPRPGVRWHDDLSIHALDRNDITVRRINILAPEGQGPVAFRVVPIAVRLLGRGVRLVGLGLCVDSPCLAAAR